VLAGAVAPGVYEFADTTETAVIGEMVTQRGWHLFHLDGRGIVDKATFLPAIAAACDFPEWFGNNWDALADSLRDLSWAPASGYVLLYEHHVGYESSPEWSMVVAIFEETTQRWERAGVPFFVLLR
jgi:hypothetical protein